VRVAIQSFAIQSSMLFVGGMYEPLMGWVYLPPWIGHIYDVSFLLDLCNCVVLVVGSPSVKSS